MDKILFTRVTLIGMAIVCAVSFIARMTFLNGSMFDPEVAPGLGPFAVGDLLILAAFVTGFIWARKKS